MKRILLISAHPDDMEIGMGGTAAKLAAAGHSLLSVVITDGRRSPDPQGIGQGAMVKLRQEEGVSACRKLGIEATRFMGFHSLSSNEEIGNAAARVAEVIDEFHPDEVYTLHPELDRHASHRAAGKVTLDAVGQSAAAVNVWAYEVWGLFPHWDRLEDITDQLDTKLQAIRKHSSQTAAIQYDEGIAGLNRWRGVFADPQQQSSPARYAEVFIKLK